jgi:hypothetical protein
MPKPSTDAQKRFGSLPINRKRLKVERDPLSGIPLDELRVQQAQLRREFYERQARKAAA